MSLMICRRHIRAPKGAFQFYGEIEIYSNFALLSLFQVKFERVINGLEGQKSNQLSI